MNINRLLDRFRSQPRSTSVPVEPGSYLARVEFNGLEIGQLTRDGEYWIFQYSPGFLIQNDIAPITDFPDTSRTYKSKTLWPFFALRIPSMTQPQVRNFVRDRSADEGALLKEFGRYCIANPFELQVAGSDRKS